jgi:hypothetical protein
VITRSHPQAVCKRSDPPGYFVQIPLHQSNLVQALAGPEAETKEDRKVRVTKLLRGLLEGLYFLHQVWRGCLGCACAIFRVAKRCLLNTN